MKLLFLCFLFAINGSGWANSEPSPRSFLKDESATEEIVAVPPFNLEQLIKGVIDVVKEPRKGAVREGGRSRVFKELAESARHTAVEEKRKPDVAILPMTIAVGEPNPAAQKPVDFSLDGYFYEGQRKIAAYRIDFRGVHFKKEVKGEKPSKELVDPRPEKPAKDTEKDDGGILIDELPQPETVEGEILIDEVGEPQPEKPVEGNDKELVDPLPEKPRKDSELVDPKPERPELVDPKPEKPVEGKDKEQVCPETEKPLDNKGQTTAESAAGTTEAVPLHNDPASAATNYIDDTDVLVTTTSKKVTPVEGTTEAVKTATEAEPTPEEEKENTPIDDSGMASESAKKTTEVVNTPQKDKATPPLPDQEGEVRTEESVKKTTEKAKPAEGTTEAVKKTTEVVNTTQEGDHTATHEVEETTEKGGLTTAAVVDDKKSTESPKEETEPHGDPGSSVAPIASEGPKASTKAAEVKATTGVGSKRRVKRRANASYRRELEQPIPSVAPLTGAVPVYTGVPPKYEFGEGKCTVAMEFSWNEKAGRCLANGTNVCNEKDWERISKKKTFGECMKTAPRVAPADGNVITDCGLGKVYAQVPGEPSALLYGRRCEDAFCPKEATCVQEKTAAHCCILARWGHYGK